MASSIKIPIEKVMDLLTKVKTKLSAPDANSASIIGYIDGQIEVLDAMKDEADVASGSRTSLETVPTVPADQYTNSGVLKLDNVQLNKMIEEMKKAAEPNIVYVQQPGHPIQDPPWYRQLTCQNVATASTNKFTLGDIPQKTPAIPIFRGADVRS